MSTSVSRPPYSTQPTATTILSSTSYNSDNRSNATTLTALTIPDLDSPGMNKRKHTLEPILDVFEGRSAIVTEMEDRYAEEKPRRTSMDLNRGPSVRDRASQFEQQQQYASSSTTNTPRGRPLPPINDMERTRSTSPLRINRKVSSSISTPTQVRRVPIPATAPLERLSTQRRTYEFEHSETSSRERLPPARLERGSGSAKKMIQQWESLPSTPISEIPKPRFPPGSGSIPMSGRVMSREYLDQKPLPIPRANPVPASSMNFHSSPGPSHSPARTAYAPSPLQHLQTPTQPNRKRSATLSPSASSWSLSPSPSNEKRKRNGGRSPLKDMLNRFGGGIQAIGRKAKGKSKNKNFVRSESFGWGDESGSEERLGTNGLPGGIVYSDRMGEEEMGMQKGPSDPNVIRSSAAMYLIPTPCSSLAPWGSWLSSWAILTSNTLHITYCPIFQGPSSGTSTPRRVLSGTNPTQTSAPAVPFNQIPQPEAGVTPDVEMAMKDCVEVRSLRRDEVRGRGIPPVPEGVGTEVLEMVWSDGSKRYIGVEGVAGRLGWVSAIWDVLLACKSTQPPTLPPPSPLVPPTTLSRNPTSTIPPASPLSASFQRQEQSEFQSRLRALEARSSGSSAPPVQKVGDTWVAGSALGVPTSDVETLPNPAAEPMNMRTKSEGVGVGLRDSVQRMFDLGPDPDLTLERPKSASVQLPMRQSSDMSERIKAWQPSSTVSSSSYSSHKDRSTAPSFSRTNSNKSTTSENARNTHVPYNEIDREHGFPTSETMLSFDPNDLNPSRSASQVRRPAPTVIGMNGTNMEERQRRYGMISQKDHLPMPILEEGSNDGSGNGSGIGSDTLTFLARPPTHISHITFPKPNVGGVQMIPSLPTIQSESRGSSSCGTDINTKSRPSTEMQTPKTRPSSITTSYSTGDPTVLAKLDTHSNEHGTLSKKIDGVQIDLKQMINSLGGFIQQSRDLSEKPTEMVIPKMMDDRLNTIQLDVKSIENSLQLSNLANTREAGKEMDDDKMTEVNEKLDKIAKLCQEVLTKQAIAPSSSSPPMRSTLTASPSEEEKSAGQEVAQIMADLTGGSSKNSPRLVGLHVLHNVSAPSSPKLESKSTLTPPNDSKSPNQATTKTTGGLPEEVTQQVGQVLSLVTELKEARTLQTQQTTDIARYLNELNTWLEKFVSNSSTELSTLSKRLNILVGSAADENSSSAGGDHTGQPGLPDLVADVHSMMSEQKRRNDSEGAVGQRLDALLGMMGEERERAAGQQNTVEQVVSILDRQRQDNEMLLRAVATDLTTEIRGERMRFIEAMQQATSVNVSMHVEEFKKLLSTEVHRSMAELGQMREEKKVLEQQISDLFALMAKHGGKGKKAASSRPMAPPSPAGGMPQLLSPVYTQGRGLPAPPPSHQ
ncbi:uncharacterized protein IL334_005580 [Kwoniella shivajii]|uniref:SH3 domain-containing protein n=1 Tax=Kwoniella shivajii TaxID=564305 RepID=A0ABZ1D3J2_9TREE|nr:hypothetical protein IL334_005580 [Kwoniella shivajii]